MKKILPLTFCASALILLSSCASNLDSRTDAKSNNSNRLDAASVTLAEAASSVSDSIVNLASIEQAAYHPVSGQPAPDPATYGMGARTSIDWSGPIEPLVQNIADSTNYHLRVQGKAPAIAIIVTLNAKNEMIGDILSNAAYQCNTRADVVVYPATQIIELRYANS